MTHLSSINALALDIARLSKTLTTLAAEIESAHMQEPATETAEEAKNTKQNQSTEAASPKSQSKTGEKDSSATSTEGTKKITIEQVRAVMAEKSQAGLTSKVKDLLEKYGANKLSAVNPDDYAALMEEAAQLK